MEVDPRIAFWIGLVTTLALALGNGSVWADTIPSEWVPAVKGWNGLLGLVGTTLLTFLHGVSSPKTGPLT